MIPFYAAEAVTLYLGDCIEVMRQMPPASVDAVVCDPPYGLEFMGKAWDRPWAVSAENTVGYAGRDDLTLPSGRDSRNANCRNCGGRQRGKTRCVCADPDWDRHPNEDMRAFQDWCEQWAREAYRVLKPGGHLAAFGGTRTYHRMASGVEDAGFEIRDTLSWMYGSGFPKSLDVSKAIDRAAGATREVVGRGPHDAQRTAANGNGGTIARSGGNAPLGQIITAPATEAARQWAGFGTALKPAYEPIVLARKPLIGTVAANVIQHGTGALNIDASRIAGVPPSVPQWESAGGNNNWEAAGRNGAMSAPHAADRWPANVLLDEAAAAMLDAQTGDLGGAGRGSTRGRDDGGSSITLGDRPTLGIEIGFGDRGGASRFFYTAKASRSEREAGLDDLPVGLSERDSIAAWVNAVLEATHRADMDRLLERVTEGFGTADDYEWNTTSSGSRPTGPSKMESRSTIETETSSTTPSTTSEPLTLQRTSEFIRAALSRLESGSSPAVFAASVSRLIERTGTSTGKAPLSTTDAARVISEQLCELSKKGGAPSRVIVRRNDHPT